MIKKSIAVLAVCGYMFGSALIAHAEGEMKFMRTLKQGDQNSDVTALQEVLAADPTIYPEGKITGYFGQLTAEAVKRFQLKSGLAAVGAVGPLTLEKLNTTLPAVSAGASQPIKGQYIVVFKNTVGNPADEAVRALEGKSGKILHAYTHAIKGFAATLPDAAVEALRKNPNVESVEQDMTVSAQATQSSAPWGLDRIDQRDRPLSTTYTYNSTGAGVYAYIIDTGVRSDHVEFTGRILPGYSVINDGNGTNDCYNHGTLVAGIIGGTTYGVAKGITLIPVRVLGCTGSGPWSDVIAGIDWVASSTLRPAIANVSISGSGSSALDAAIAGAVEKGVTMVVAAGNNNLDACAYSPARVQSAITVGAVTSNDVRGIYSNFGTCLDLFAPGSGIPSASSIDTTSSKIMSGTSMASPHVAGVASFILQANPSTTPADVAAQIITNATVNRIGTTTLGIGSPNLLLYSLLGGGGTTPPPPPPPPATQTIAVKTILGTSVKSGSGWRASGTVTVYDVTTNATVAGVTVKGSFSPGGTVSCVTSSSTGSCTLTSSIIKRNQGTATTLSITNLSGTNMTYDASRNLQSQIVITAP